LTNRYDGQAGVPTEFINRLDEVVFDEHDEDLAAIVDLQLAAELLANRGQTHDDQWLERGPRSNCERPELRQFERALKTWEDAISEAVIEVRSVTTERSRSICDNELTSLHHHR
jgi:hypothetical protein